jgi:plasmid replication initiation protein
VSALQAKGDTFREQSTGRNMTNPVSNLVAFVEEEEPDEIGGSVTMSRALAESAHGLTLNEARVMMLAMRCVNPRKSVYAHAKDGYVKVRIKADEFAQLAGLEQNSRGHTPMAAYEGLKAACDKLYDRSAHWREGKKEIRMRWVWKAQYHNGEGWAEICFSPDMTPHIFSIGRKYVRYRLEYARGLQSIYSSHLLRLLMTQKDNGFKTITLEDFRHAMEIPESYKYSNIKQRVINVAIKELNEKADWIIQYRETKRGRSVHSLQFTFAKNPQTRLELDEAK